MIPSTYPSSINGTSGLRQMRIFYLSSISGLTRWVDYIPVKQGSSLLRPNSFDTGGYILTEVLSSTTGLQSWVDYVPVYEDAAATDAWQCSSAGYIVVDQTNGDADAAAWAAAVTSNGGTYSAGTLAAVTTFCQSAKASGYWSKLNRINLICGNQLAAALVPLKVGSGSATETNVNFVAGDYTEATGLTGNAASKYLRTGVVASTAMTLNDTHLSLYARTGTGAGTNMGTTDGTNFFDLYAMSGGSAISDAYNNVGGRLTVAVANPPGFIIGSKTASNAHSLYRNGSSIGSNATTGGSLPALELYVGALNSSGAAAGASGGPIAAYSIGSGLTAGDVTAFYTHMQAFQTALGRNV